MFFLNNISLSWLFQRKKTKFAPKYKWFKISYLELLFENTFSGTQLFYIRPHFPVDIITFFFNFRFFSRKSQSHQKLAKKIAHFTIQFRSKSLTHFMNLMKIICSRTTAKNLSDFKNVPANIILFGFRKNICTAPFLLAQDCILKALWKQMSVYLRKKIFFPKSSKILSDRGWVGGRLNNLLKAARSLGSVKCFPIFHFNRNF